MTRKEIIESVMGLGLTNQKAKIAVEAFLAEINKALRSAEKVKLAGFGTFYVKSKPARRGINPKTGDKIQIPAKKYPVFKASPQLRKKINK